MMIWIELLGPSGVGKSHWYYRFLKAFPQLDPQKLLLKRIYERRKEMKIPFRIKLFFFFYHLKPGKLTGFFRQFLITYFTEKYTLPHYPSDQDEKIANDYLREVEKYREPAFSILSKIQYFAKKLQEFRVYSHFLKQDDVYIAEDGLLHLSPMNIEELKPDVYIVFNEDRELILRRRQERQQHSPRLIDTLLGKEEFQLYLDNYFNLYEEKIGSLDQEKTINITPSESMDFALILQKIKEITV